MVVVSAGLFTQPQSRLPTLEVVLTFVVILTQFLKKSNATNDKKALVGMDQT